MERALTTIPESPGQPTGVVSSGRSRKVLLRLHGRLTLTWPSTSPGTCLTLR